MQRDNAIERWVEHLNRLTPVQGLIHVGAGATIANSFYAEWPLQHVLLLEADESSAAKLTQATQHRNGWEVLSALVSSKSELCDFYVASNPNESGLIAPELLTPLWKNLKAKEVRALKPSSLSHVITQQQSNANWLVVETLSALDVLQSAGKQLNQFDVICVRALRHAISEDLEQYSQELLDRYLAESGFTLLQIHEEVQSSVIHLLYAKDWKKILHVEKSQFATLLAEKDALIILGANNARTLLAEEAHKTTQLLETEKQANQIAVYDLKKRMDEATNQHQQELAEKDAQAKNAVEKIHATLEEANKYTKLLESEKRVFESAVAELKKQINDTENQYKIAVAEKEAQAKSASEKTQALLAEQASKNAQLMIAEKETHQAAIAEMEALAQLAKQKVEALLTEEGNKNVQLNAEKQAHQSRIAELKKQIEDIEARYQKALAEKTTQLQSEIEKIQSDFREDKQQLLNNFEEERRSFALKLSEADLLRIKILGEKERDQANFLSQLTDLQKVIADQALSIQRLLEEKTSALLTSFKDQNARLEKLESGIKNQVKNSASNTAKQLEAFWSIQSYFESATMLPELHGYPISPDVGLSLISLIDANNYDLIIEFGSGSSTELMAKAMLTKHAHPQSLQGGAAEKLLALDGGLSVTTQRLRTLPDFSVDLPARIVSFDHHADYYAKTKARLERVGLSSIVDLVHAPLVDYKSSDGRDFLFYKCFDKLKSINTQLNGRKINVLVLVDGPPGATNAHARYPAFEILLDLLSEQKLTIVLDDYERQEEKEVAEQWKAHAKKRSFIYTFREVNAEKGMAIFEVNFKTRS